MRSLYIHPLDRFNQGFNVRRRTLKTVYNYYHRQNIVINKWETPLVLFIFGWIEICSHCFILLNKMKFLSIYYTLHFYKVRLGLFQFKTLSTSLSVCKWHGNEQTQIRFLNIFNTIFSRIKLSNNALNVLRV